MSPMKILELRPESIDLSDKRFSYSFPEHQKELAKSIKEVGVLEPIIIRRKKDSFIIVSGFRRAFFAKEFGIVIPCILKDNISDKDAFSLAVFANLHRGFNIFEKAEILKKLYDFRFCERDIFERFVPILELPKSPSIINQYLSLNNLSYDQKLYLFERSLPVQHIFKLASLPKEVREHLFKLFLKFKLTTSRIRIFVDLFEIAFRKQKEAVFEGLFSSDDPFRYLKSISYPSLFKKEELFKKTLCKYGIKGEVKLIPKSGFEEFELNMRFKDKRSFMDSLKKLEKLVFEDIF